eukprot:CAMPEP_0183737570 /NCGR_PEP_ID=MMETSP0737-20130205/52361_1 /TAXON_ID=385413 /ORGANISM="Thalassiosira miniscula, Strain CCMP1093" /LENGTH=643 /DNA_ID=CAMNT_0025971879 /DNA_START=78 /DNA_END=2009 /DNA_ORIENTATION=+
MATIAMEPKSTRAEQTPNKSKELAPARRAPSRRTRLASRMPSDMRRSSKDLMASFTKGVIESLDADHGSGNNNCVESVSAAPAVQLVADDIYRMGIDPQTAQRDIEHSKIEPTHRPELEPESKSSEKNATTSKQASLARTSAARRLRASLTSKIPFDIRKSSKDLMANFTKSLSDSIGADHCIETKNCAESVSAARAAQLVNDNIFRKEPDPEFVKSSLINANEVYPMEIISQDKDGSTDTTCSESRESAPSFEDALALEVGLSAHEYLEECFYTEVSVLDRDKFNAVPEVVKSDFTIVGHLGKGSFSDVFEVVYKDCQLEAGVHNIISGGTDQNRRRSPVARRSSSINMGYLARPSECEHVYAIKCLRPQIRSDANQFTIGAEDLVHETAILANLKHKNIIKLHGRASGHLTNAFVLNDGYFILLDKLNETLSDYINAWKSRAKTILQKPTVKQIEVAHSISNAVSYLHSKKIVFRDLKPDNVGFDSKGVLKLFDFGFAVGLPEKGESNPTGLLFDRCGTPRYMAPEVGLSLGYGTKADVYSFGILLWEILAMSKPYAAYSSAEFEKAVFVKGDRPVIYHHWPATMKDLISRCWSASPSQRPTILGVKASLLSVMAIIAGDNKIPVHTVRSNLTRRRSDVGG